MFDPHERKQIVETLQRTSEELIEEAKRLRQFAEAIAKYAQSTRRALEQMLTEERAERKEQDDERSQ